MAWKEEHPGFISVLSSLEYIWGKIVTSQLREFLRDGTQRVRVDLSSS